MPRISCKANGMEKNMNRDRIIIVHDLEQAMLALKAAATCTRAVTLRSAPEAAAYLSPAVFLAMIEEAATAEPEANYTAALDCGDKPGLVMNALRHGVKIVRANLSDDVQAKMNSIAEQTKALVIPYDDTPALDLHNADDPATACRDWLEKT